MLKFNKTNESTSRWLQTFALLCAILVLPISLAPARGTAAKASNTNEGHAEGHNFWNQFRGPHGDGKSLTKDLPAEFSETKNVRWKTPIHDKGWSSPVVWGDQIWLTTGRQDGSELFAVCVDLESGDVIHDIKVFNVADPQKQWQGQNTHASPTPIVEAGRVYVHFGTYGTACLDTKTGDKLWERRDLNCDHRVRPASSPIIDGDSLFLHFDGVDAQFVTALDKNTGKTLWLKHRGIDSDLGAVLKAEGLSDTDIEETKKEKPNDNRKAYATPSIITHQGRRQLISPAAEVTFSYDPTLGEELWRVRHPGWGWNAACRPIFEHGLVYLTTGVSRRLLAIRPSGTGDVTDTHVAWSHRKLVPNMPSPLIVDDLLFMVSDQGWASCLDAKTGDELWRKRLRAGGNHWASPVHADGKIYFSGKKGVVSVIAAARDLQLLAENRFDASFIASLAVANDAIILRSLTHLYCVSAGTGDDWFEAWHNSDQWDVAGDAALNPDNVRRLVGKTGNGVLINGKEGKCPSLVTKRRDYRDVEVHLEFMVAKGSNSGVIFHGNHEIQILDSYGVEKPNAGHCGGVYPRAESKPTYHHIDKGSPPRVNAARPPGEWQTMDIIFQAARFDDDGNKTAHARFVKVVHNGIVIQENVEVPYACGPNWDRKQYPQGPIIIQGDYGPIAVRNVRIQEWKADKERGLKV
ncbi:MAG: family 16 glycoside hydrolase, partial [Planctomycetota bacterium]